ncbi:MAG TPA: thioredoxin domain-containing protein [Bdellovibrionota bacterium]|nr:thioredoxin domain-containing protein [Bdellovibrionota bacterium]
MLKKIFYVGVVVIAVGCSQKDKQNPKEVLAEIEGEKITWADIEKEVSPQLTMLEQKYEKDVFSLKMAYLQQKVGEKILTKEAEKQGLTVPQLMQKEMMARNVVPDDKEVEEFYKQNKKILELRFPQESKKQHMEKIKDFISRQKRAQTEYAYVNELQNKYSVVIHLESPRVEVSADDDPSRGPAKAPITIVEFSDFTCQFCSQAYLTVKKVLDNPKFKDKIKFVYRDSPAQQRPAAFPAAMAAQCAHDQGKFWEYHDKLFENSQDLTPTKLKELSKTVGLEEAKFNQCLDTKKYEGEVTKDLEDGFRVGVTGTPTFFVNGLKINIPPGDQGVLALEEVVNKELGRKKN